MNRFVKIGLLMVLVMALFGSYRFVKAQNERSRPAASAVAPAVISLQGSNIPPTTIKHVLMGTIINTCGSSCSSGSFPAGGTTPIDAPTTVTCPGTSGTCTLEADQVLQVGVPGSLVGLCFYVDGTLVNGACFYTDETPADGSFTQTHTTQSISGVPHGTHMVQSFVYSSVGGVYDYYNFDYRVYKP